MTVFFGFDLGDAESAVATIDPVSSSAPQIQELAGTKSIVTAYAYTKDGQLLIGEKACYAPDCVTRRDRFKSRFLTDPEAAKDVAAFASGILADLKRSGTLKNTDEDAVFYIGCPAGWDRNVREEYRQIFAKCGGGRFRRFGTGGVVRHGKHESGGSHEGMLGKCFCDRQTAVVCRAFGRACLRRDRACALRRHEAHCRRKRASCAVYGGVLHGKQFHLCPPR